LVFRKKVNMSSTDSIETSDADPKRREQTTAELHPPPSNTAIGPNSRAGTSGRRLDVDAVLERSVRKVVGE
jgi:hypothetical protein